MTGEECNLQPDFAQSGSGMCGSSATGPYLYFHSGSASYTFTVPDHESQIVTYGIPAGDFLNNADASISVDGGPAVT